MFGQLWSPKLESRRCGFNSLNFAYNNKTTLYIFIKITVFASYFIVFNIFSLKESRPIAALWSSYYHLITERLTQVHRAKVPELRTKTTEIFQCASFISHTMSIHATRDAE